MHNQHLFFSFNRIVRNKAAENAKRLHSGSSSPVSQVNSIMGHSVSQVNSIMGATSVNSIMGVNSIHESLLQRPASYSITGLLGAQKQMPSTANINKRKRDEGNYYKLRFFCSIISHKRS